MPDRLEEVYIPWRPVANHLVEPLVIVELDVPQAVLGLFNCLVILEIDILN
ncbi:hypothetical protein D3C87_1793190 [compost metagenome]